MNKKKENSFENSIKRLEEISNALENEDISLDESIKLYEEGIKLAKYCYETLRQAELKITELKKEINNTLNQQENN
ncbi:exodeoxyribonuclease VII small subunit [Melioribacteraceae bacterium 4301-Me]|uniref:exodeoxyribonuclease VII small subunit n=1 Tax=Pyranulibacter aquaticus TaxID=3163344 RepID=UPI00359A7375